MEEKKASVGARITQEAAAGQAAAAINSMPAALTTFRCPLDGRVFASYADLVDHYNAEHPDSVVPITVTLTINGKNCEILLEPHWTLKQALQFKLGLTGAKMQCGYCTPGFLVTAKCLLDRNPHPTEMEIKKALSGNICICGTYPRHSQAILEAAEIIGKGEN